MFVDIHKKNIRIYKKTIVIFLALLLPFTFFPLTGCGKKHEPYVSSSTELRDNTPLCLTPTSPGDVVFENELVSVDASNSSEGYITVTYLGDSSLVKLQVTGPDYMTYTYDITDNEPEIFPISAGNGGYTIGVYENVEGNQYATIFTEESEFNITNEKGAFLYPNQYVKFDENSEPVRAAVDIVKDAHDDLEAITCVYNYMINNITYDLEKAENIESGYIPDIDHIWEIKTGICLDYAAVMTSMLRSQRIPTRMEVGYAGEAYHAWISCYAENIGWINGLVEFDGKDWSLMDPTVAANQGQEALQSFIGNGENYITKFIY
ncbi:MAG: transglutaminase-like domain-containing protein [Lachnospiraceae bacterium]|nr:transglutaminase-like domain-containing protein [Lachnospiraceae bacterium]